PQVIATITARVMTGVQVDPVFLGSAAKVVSAFADTVSLERQAALEAGYIHATRLLEIDCWFHFFVAPIPSDEFAN
ncbi:MAG: hypothetical protein ACJ79N_10205, partial [Gemmatimonadaceae bacterium]